MTTVAFIGLGNMGGPMAANLARPATFVKGFDLSAALLEAARRRVEAAASAGEAVANADVVVTMLPAGKRDRGLVGITSKAKKGALLIDSSTVDVDSARRPCAGRKAACSASTRRFPGGTGGFGAAPDLHGGGSDAAPAAARPVLEKMGKKIVHCGGAGAGPGRQDLQQHDPRGDDDRHGRGLRSGRKLGLTHQACSTSRPDLVGPELVDDLLLPVPEIGASLAGNNDYKPGFAARADAEGPEAGAGSGIGQRGDAARRGRRPALRPVQRRRACGRRFLGIINFLRGQG